HPAGGDYEPTDQGYMLRAESHDGGWTWSDARTTPFKNPNSAVDFLKLQNGHLLLVFNDHMYERSPLTVAVSMGDDETWPCRRNIQEGENSFAYPYAIQAKDGKIHVVFTTNERTVIMHAVFEESDILGPAAKEGK
ncbi:MAG TPA: exo-alpha-sialidase, partial [bacterium]|nr:exo-alpha-sialidase [bacterium]